MYRFSHSNLVLLLAANCIPSHRSGSVSVGCLCSARSEIESPESTWTWCLHAKSPAEHQPNTSRTPAEHQPNTNRIPAQHQPTNLTKHNSELGQNRGQAIVIVKVGLITVSLLEFYVLTTSLIISEWVPTYD